MGAAIPPNHEPHATHHHHHHHHHHSARPSLPTAWNAHNTLVASPAEDCPRSAICKKPTKCFTQRTCAINRTPSKSHSTSHCSGAPTGMTAAFRGLSPSSDGSRAGTPLPRFLDNSGSPFIPQTSAPVVNGHNTSYKDVQPKLLHRVKHERSILSLAVSELYVYAGSQSGEILVWSIETYELVAQFKAHEGSVLSLCLAEDECLLFSTAGDAILNVWHSETFEHLYSIYSTFDVGDVFCVVYSKELQIAWFGAQNTSIQWYDLKAKDSQPRPTIASHPSLRNHRFFDSKGPGGLMAPQPSSAGATASLASQLLEVDSQNIRQYAHYGYVYCMLLVQSQQIGRGEGEVLLSGGGDGDVKLWNISPSTGAITEAQRLEGGDSGVLSMAVSDTLLYCGLTDGEICIWDLDTLQRVRTIKAHCDDVLTMSVSRNYIFSGSASGYTRNWDNRFQCVARWQSHSGLVLASAVTTRRDRLLYITGGNDDCVAIWDVSASEIDALKTPSQTQNDQLLASLSKLVSFRTVASNPVYKEDCRRGATYLKTLFKRVGAMSTLINTENDCNPIVFARFTGGAGLKKPQPKGKTILFYGHYDVIPAETNQKSGWKTDPFELTGLNGYLYGRGVSDNKGPCLAALFAAGELLEEGELDCDIVFLIEGEEERGSRGFKNAVRKNKELIGEIGWVLLANSYWLDDKTPCLTYGLRGVIHATISIESDKPDLHSGVDGSLLNREPTIELVNLLAGLSSQDGRVQLPGFYEPVRSATAEEETMYGPVASTLKNNPSSPYSGMDVDEIKKHLMAKWREPSLTIHRVKVSGPSNATVIPRSASAAISLRIVPDQEVETIKASIIDFFEQQYSHSGGKNRLKVSIDHEAEPWLGDPGNAAFKTLEYAVSDVWAESEMGKLSLDEAAVSEPKGPKLLHIREGGSIPGARFLEKEFEAPAAHLPCGQSSDHAHLDNERLRLVNLYNSKEILKRVFRELPRKEE